jgi:23S rRNA pseudouridine1911/1915/1917 synthase
MATQICAQAAARLLDCLRTELPTWKRKTLEQRIRGGCVRVNGATVVRPETSVASGDRIEVGDTPSDTVASAALRLPFPLLHDDAHIVAIDKPAGLLSVATETGGERTALSLLRAGLALPSRGRSATEVPLWPVHRIDRETSGVLLFAKTQQARETLQRGWSSARKLYLAVIDGRIEPPSGLIDAPLWEDTLLFVHAGAHPSAKPARTRYATLRTQGTRALLEIELETGRRHQIRAHLASRGCTIVGDTRYGPPDARAPRMGLHALRLVVSHPDDGRELVLEAPPPRAFDDLLR